MNDTAQKKAVIEEIERLLQKADKIQLKRIQAFLSEYLNE